MQESEIWLYYQMLYTQIRICPGEWDAQHSLVFWDKDHLLSARRPDLVMINQNQKQKQKKNPKRTIRIMDFAVRADHSVKTKLNKKRARSFIFARELKKQWRMKVTLIQITNGTLGTVTISFVRGAERVDIQRTSRDHPNYSIAEIDQKTEKSLGHTRWFIFT